MPQLRARQDGGQDEVSSSEGFRDTHTTTTGANAQYWQGWEN